MQKNNIQFGYLLAIHMQKTNRRFIMRMILVTKTVDWFNTY